MPYTFFHCIPVNPLAQIEKPIVAPTTLCVVETGNSANVAIINHKEQPKNIFLKI